MRKFDRAFSFLLLATLCGCSGMNNTDKGLLGGAAVGTAAGTAIGLATRNPVAGAVVGGMAGAAIGGIAGSNQDQREARDRYTQAQATALANAARNQMSLTDIVQLAQRGTGDDIIIRQMDATNSVFQLATNDITYLQDQGVSRNVIAAMQARTTRTVVVQPRPVVIYDAPPPPPIGVGIGFGYRGGWR